ncbi:MAG: hypothetical protein LBO64_02845 [Desulfovibrio sp.]|nr:hypothetical protein [Desulfovibrio sp.]
MKKVIFLNELIQFHSESFLEKTQFFQKSTPLRGALPLRAMRALGLFQSQNAVMIEPCQQV